MNLYNFYNLQLQKTLESLENHWANIINLQDKSRFDKRDGTNFIPWFGDIKCWLTELKNFDYGSYPEFNLSAIYPKAICNKANICEIAKELDLLLPKGDTNVSSILPVLITAYIVNRRAPTKRERANESTTDYQGTPSFVDFLLDSRGPKLSKEDKKAERKAPKRQIEPRKMLQDKKKLFLLKTWNDSFPKIKYSQINKGKAQMLLSGYGCMRLFFFLLYKLQGVCNVSLSYFVFEVMTRYVDLLTPDGEYLWDKKHERDYPWFSNEKEVASDNKKAEILTWVEKDFGDVIVFTGHEESLTEKDLPMSLYRYLYNIKEELIEREEKERGAALSEEEISAGYKLFAELDFVFVPHEYLPLSSFMDDDFVEVISEDSKNI